MRDDASLRRLAEMGVDVYLPRGLRRTAGPLAIALAAPEVSAIPARNVAATEPLSSPARVLLLGDGDSKSASAVLADVARTLGFARIASVRALASDEPALAQAHALVMFGERHARTVGAVLPAQRQREIGWVVSVELPQLVRDARAKRALWSELKRMARGLGVTPRSLAEPGAGDDHRSH